LPMFYNCGSLSIRSCKLRPHAKPSGANTEIGTRHVNFSAHYQNACYRAPRRLYEYRQRNPWLVEFVIELNRQQGFRQGFSGLLVRGPVERGFTSSLLNEKFTRAISGLVLRSLVCGGGPHDLILKKSQFYDIGKQIRSSLNLEELIGLNTSSKNHGFQLSPI